MKNDLKQSMLVSAGMTTSQKDVIEQMKAALDLKMKERVHKVIWEDKPKKVKKTNKTAMV